MITLKTLWFRHLIEKSHNFEKFLLEDCVAKGNNMQYSWRMPLSNFKNIEGFFGNKHKLEEVSVVIPILISWQFA